MRKTDRTSSEVVPSAFQKVVIQRGRQKVEAPPAVDPAQLELEEEPDAEV